MCGTAELRTLPLLCQSQVFFSECCVSSTLFLFPMSPWSGSGETLAHSLFLSSKYPNSWEIAEPPPPPFLPFFAVKFPDFCSVLGDGVCSCCCFEVTNASWTGSNHKQDVVSPAWILDSQNWDVFLLWVAPASSCSFLKFPLEL